MKKILPGVLLLALLSACVVPINSSYESARMLKKGETEIMGHFTHYSFSEEGENESTNNNLGIRLGTGVTNNFDLKLRYIRLMAVEENATDINYIDLAPKVGLLPGKIAAMVPVGVYFDSEETEWVISPKVLFTYPASDRFEATLAAKMDIFTSKGADDYLGFNLGLGLSEDLKKWAFRPEVGLMVNPGESGVAWSFGIGITGVIPGKRREATR